MMSRTALVAALQAGLLALAMGCTPFVAAGPGERLILGVQTHFAYDRSVNAARVIEWVKAARIDSTRDEMFWNDVEDASGSYALRNSAQASRQVWWNQLPGTAPLLILGYGHPRYDAGGQPRSAEAVRAYAGHAGWLVGETKQRVRMVELWNEWNLKAGAVPAGGAQGGAAEYVRMAAAARQAVKAADPGVLVLVGGVGEDHPDWRWMREALSLGLMDGADGVSLHLYNHCDTGNVGADEMLRRLERLQGIMSASRPAEPAVPRGDLSSPAKPDLLKKPRAGRDVPIYLTEVGWPVHKGACEVSEDLAGVFTLRLLLEASLRDWLKGVWVYEAIDSGDDPANREHRFGLLRRDGSERVAGCAVREFGAVIAARPAQKIQQGNVTLAVYHEAGRSTVFVWDREGSRGARVRARTSAATVPTAMAAPPCQLKTGSVAALASQLELRAELDGARPAVFVLPQLVTIEGVQID